MSYSETRLVTIKGKNKLLMVSRSGNRRKATVKNDFATGFGDGASELVVVLRMPEAEWSGKLRARHVEQQSLHAATAMGAPCK